MKRIKNPFIGGKDYLCFACCPDNSIGLQLDFFEDEESVITKWLPEQKFTGWMNVVHGGIQSTILDELANWFVLVKLKTAGMTIEMELKYKKPLEVSGKEVIATAKLNKQIRHIAIVDVELRNADDEVCTFGTIKCYMVPKEKAEQTGMYPGEDKF